MLLCHLLPPCAHVVEVGRAVEPAVAAAPAAVEQRELTFGVLAAAAVAQGAAAAAAVGRGAAGAAAVQRLLQLCALCQSHHENVSGQTAIEHCKRASPGV